MKRCERLVCNQDLLKRICSNLQRFPLERQDGKGLKRAAVASTVVDVADGPGVYGLSAVGFSSDDAALVLTRRAMEL